MIRILMRGLLALFIALPLVYPGTASGQTSALQLQSVGLQERTVRANPLQRPVTLDVMGMRLGDVLAEISLQADLGLIYGNDLVPVNRLVTAQFHATPAGQALRRVLADTDLDFALTNNQQVVLVRQAPPPVAPERPRVLTGTLIGTVTDVDSGEGIATADIWLDGTQWRTVTSAEGRYLLANVPAGEYNLRAQRIGYAEANQIVTVIADQATTADFALKSTPTRLDELVVTVTGEQRIRELGHVVGRINADSLVRAAPISNISELLNGRVPGLQVFQTSGTVGGMVQMRMRSESSINLSQEPIVIVDGVRYTSGLSGGDHYYGGGAYRMSTEPTSRLNDLNPNDIATIEVVKGPSAATLYGTDAANGVIVITTKGGHSGPPRWHTYARAGVTEMPKFTYPDAYWGWGSATSSCTLRNMTAGLCTQDSVTVIPNPLNDSDLTIFGTKPRWEYGANVSGGGDALRYYLSADIEEAAGALTVPAAMVREFEELAGPGEKLSKSQITPNHMKKLNLRANISTNLGENTIVRVNLGYTQNSTRQVSFEQGPFSSTFSYRQPGTDPYGSYEFDNPLNQFAMHSTEYVNRFYGNTTAEWRPVSWLQTRALVGVDMPSTFRYSLGPRDAWEGYTGMVGDARTRHFVTTGELGTTASVRSGRLSSRTSVGAQYVRNHNNAMMMVGGNLRPGGSSIRDAATVTTTQSYTEVATLGSYLEQMFGLNDRLFLTAAVRADGASTFGSDYKAAFYPKIALSWVVSEEPFVPEVPGLDNLRLRYAFGASGQQPKPEMHRMNFAVTQTRLEGMDQSKMAVNSLASPDLRPERVKEHEFGLDASALEGRIALDLTWSRRRVVDQIHSLGLTPGMGSIWTNLGLVTANGFESQLATQLVDLPTFSWDLTLNHATHSNKIIDLGGLPNQYRGDGGVVEGYPIGGRFYRPMFGYEDLNGDGIISADEVIMGDTAHFAGPGIPKHTQALMTALGFFGQRLRVSAMLERRAGFAQWDGMASMRAAVDPTTSLDDQARAVARQMVSTPEAHWLGYGNLKRGDFIRFRELTVAFSMPERWMALAGVSQATLSLSGRNLGLWVQDGGPDPESARLGYYTGGIGGGRSDKIPQSRTWVARMDLNF